MLNAVALLFILEIDDLLYKAGLEVDSWQPSESLQKIKYKYAPDLD